MAATPLQICMLGSAIANGGKVYQPTLIDRLEEWQYDRNGQRQQVITKIPPKLRANLLEHGVKKRDMDNMREGMRLVVNDPKGTGKSAQSKIWTIAGKTGTAQKDRFDENKKKFVDNRTWFMSFAPYEAPKIAVCVMVVNGKAGGAVPAPIAKRVIEQTLSLFPDNEGKYTGRVPKVQPLEPAKGHFNYLEKPAFKDDDSVTAPDEEEATGEDDDTADTGPAAGIPEPVTKPAPRAQIVLEEDDKKATTAPKLQPVQFRLKSDPPNPPPAAPPAKAR
jgi:penicillin-binding protein 2